MYDVRQVRLNTGEVLYHLADKATGLPDAYAFRYILVEVRPSGASSGTIRNKVRAIGIGMSFLRSRDIYVEQRIRTGRFLEAEELLALGSRFSSKKDGTGRIDGGVAGDRYATFVEYLTFRTGEVRD